jgi:hypothetical protein
VDDLAAAAASRGVARIAAASRKPGFAPQSFLQARTSLSLGAPAWRCGAFPVHTKRDVRLTDEHRRDRLDAASGAVAMSGINRGLPMARAPATHPRCAVGAGLERRHYDHPFRPRVDTSEVRSDAVAAQCGSPASGSGVFRTVRSPLSATGEEVGALASGEALPMCAATLGSDSRVSRRPSGHPADQGGGARPSLPLAQPSCLGRLRFMC